MFVVLGGANGESNGFLGMSFETGTCKKVDYGGVRVEVVVAKRFGFDPLEKMEEEVGFVLYAEGNLGKVGGADAVGIKGVEGGPAGFGTVVGEDAYGVFYHIF
ncbi:hypothetical protein PIB30_064169 [Stylosanthes scabra]|uniref:Uncharacterized protein n=1 Tax=Stylosanthes scabra TaxID=79078 RepID=A0ABU6XJI6_9FABA|nr:hypothetical protein [Stylosanthes scabra]